MDNLWIFLVIIGAVFSMVQKNQQKNKPVGEDNEPTLAPQTEWERRVRELLGEDKTPENRLKTSSTQVEPQKSRETTPESKMQPMASTTTVQKPKMASQMISMNRGGSSIATTAKSNSKATKSNNDNTTIKTSGKAKYGNPIKDGDITAQNSEINEILEDFTMEKAVIYSEILRPKFEE